MSFLAGLGSSPVLGVPQFADEQQGPITLKQLSLEELSQIEVISAAKEPTPISRTPAAVYVLKGDEIRRAGVTTIPDALRLVPGVEVAQIDASKWSVGIRGFGSRLSRAVLVLIDGRTVYSPLFAGTYWEVQDTLLEDIDRIEVIRGPGGSIWGPNSFNGVINILTKHTSDTQGTLAALRGGSQEWASGGFRYGGKGPGSLSYRLYGKGFVRGPMEHSDGDNFDRWRGTQGGFRMDWKLGERDAFLLSGDVYRQAAGERVGFSSYLPAVTKAVDGIADLSGGDILARWKRTVTEDRDYQVQFSYDRANRVEPNFGERRDSFELDFIARIGMGERQTLAYGLGGRLSNGRFHEVSTGLVFDPAQRTDYIASAFLEDSIELARDRLYLIAGSKVLRTNFTAVAFQPSLRLLWTPAKRHTLWAAFTHAVRTPSRGEREFYISSYFGQSGDLPAYGRFNANPAFADELLNGFEAGYRSLIMKNFYVDLTAFSNGYHNLFSQDLIGTAIETTLPFPNTTPPFPRTVTTARFQNDFYGRTEGVEVAPEWRPYDFWRLHGSYSYLMMNIEKRSGTAPGNAPSDVTGASPRHQALVQSSFDIGKRFQADLIYRYVAGLPAQRLPGYRTGDVRGAWNITPRLEFAVTGRNLMQPRHVEFVGDPGGGVAIRRSVFASLTWK